MPTLPFNPIPQVQSTGAPGVFQRVDTDPGMFGAFTAAGAQKVGAAMDQLGGADADNLIRFQREYNETAVDQANTSFDATTRDAVANFRQLRGQDALNAQASTLQAIEDSRQQVRASLANPEQQRMYDLMSRQNARRYLDEVAFHAATEGKVWQGDVANGAITNALNDISNYWNDDQRFALGLGNIKIQAGKLLQLKGIDPNSDTGKAAIQSYVGQAWTARIHSVMAHDSDLARAMFDANADQIDAAHRSTLDAQITNRQWTDMMRTNAQQQRDEMAAERQMRTTQAANLAKLTADAISGRGVNMASVADMIRTQQLSPGAADFLLTVSRRAGAGPETDRAATVIALHQAINDPSVGVDERMKMIQDAARSGRITATTAGSLVDAAYRRDQHVETQVEREARGAALAAAGVPDGMINLSHDDAQRKAAVMSEWTNRVTIGGEDPIEVRDDLARKYSPPGIPPPTWPQPEYGAIHSTQDVATVWGATKAALASGAITKEKYDQEATNILRYQQFYKQIDAARAAQAQARTKQQPGGPKAKVRGVVPGEGS